MKLREVPRGAKFKFVGRPPYSGDWDKADPVFEHLTPDGEWNRNQARSHGEYLLVSVGGQALVSNHNARYRNGHVLDL